MIVKKCDICDTMLEYKDDDPLKPKVRGVLKVEYVNVAGGIISSIRTLCSMHNLMLQSSIAHAIELMQDQQLRLNE